MTDSTFLQRIAAQQDDPEQFLADLKRVQNEQDDTPKPLRRFKLEFELDEDDLEVAIQEVTAHVERHEDE